MQAATKGKGERRELCITLAVWAQMLTFAFLFCSYGWLRELVFPALVFGFIRMRAVIRLKKV